MQMILKTIYVLVITLGLVSIFAFTLRGLPGNPDAAELLSMQWTWDGPLELSPERGRIALLYSYLEDRSLFFSQDIARLALPDLAINAAGEYVSLFSPGPSFLAIPGYLLGKHFGMALVGAFATSAFFALLNCLLIYLIAVRLGALKSAALLGALTFSFATPALTYASTLYQHHMSVFFLLLSVWVLVRFKASPLILAVVWFSCATSVVIDNPNLFLMLPVGMFAVGKLWMMLVEKYQQRKLWRNVFGNIVALVAFMPALLFLGWYNQHANGSPWQLPGTLHAVDAIGGNGEALTDDTYNPSLEKNTSDKPQKTAVGFFKTRNLYNGFYIHFISPDRGILYFTPVILLGILGLWVLYRRNAWATSLLIAVIGMNVLLYSMWGDPWGGWAFGSRYLIPTYALLAIGVGLALSHWQWKKLLLVIFLPLFMYSAWVNSLGAITTSLNPPKVQVLSLEQDTGHEEKYTFIRNWEFLHGKYDSVESKAFIYQVWAKKHMSATEYHRGVFGLIVLLAGMVWAVLLVILIKSKKA